MEKLCKVDEDISYLARLTNQFFSMQVFSNSEIAKLKTVLVHRPDEGISRISPKRAEELLFDDIVHVPRMQYEHDVFTGILKHFVGEEQVLETQKLLEEALAVDSDSTIDFLERIVSYEELPSDYIKYLLDLSFADQADTLITGYLVKEERYLFDPIPNFIFTRDIAVTVKDHVVITKANKEARYRENLLTRFIFRTHPLLSHLAEEDKIINLNNLDKFPPSKMGEVVSIEGGDVMMFNDDYILIGSSERTTAHAIDSLASELFTKDVIDNVAQLVIPNNRSYMHIDTIFTQIDNDDIICFKPIVFDGTGSHVKVRNKSGEERFYHSIKEFIHAEINPKMRFIFAGKGESPYQDREQWTDGCNMVAIKPGVAVSYDRNPVTDIALKDAGYKIILGEELLEKLNSGELKASDIEKTIINIPSNELSRARGGSHCMTCPILREKL